MYCTILLRRDVSKLSKKRCLALWALIFLMIAALVPLLSGCGYWAVEEASVQVGDAVIRVTQAPALNE